MTAKEAMSSSTLTVLPMLVHIQYACQPATGAHAHKKKATATLNKNKQPAQVRHNQHVLASRFLGLCIYICVSYRTYMRCRRAVSRPRSRLSRVLVDVVLRLLYACWGLCPVLIPSSRARLGPRGREK
jgi:hypothetical protein